MVAITLGGNNYDSFISEADATIYLAGDIIRAAPWALLAADAQRRALISATRLLMTMPWCDVDSPPDPSGDAASIDDTVEEVCAMLAADLAAKPKLFADASGNSNVKSAKAGSAQVEFFSPVEGGPPIPRSLWDRLNAAGLVCLGSTSAIDGPTVSGICDDARPLWGRYPWDWPVAAADYD